MCFSRIWQRPMIAYGPDKTKAPEIPRQRAHGHVTATPGIDRPQFAEAGIQDPELVLVPPRRVGHAQAIEQDLVVADVEQQASRRLFFAPPARRIGRAEGGDVCGLAVDDRQSVEVAAVFRGNLRDERGVPLRGEAEVGAEAPGTQTGC